MKPVQGQSTERSESYEFMQLRRQSSCITMRVQQRASRSRTRSTAGHCHCSHAALGNTLWAIQSPETGNYFSLPGSAVFYSRRWKKCLTDGQALDAFSQAMAQRKQLLDSFAKEYEPLTLNCVCPETNNKSESHTKYPGQKHFTWSDGPLPWDCPEH